jgi:hypothetical protein
VCRWRAFRTTPPSSRSASRLPPPASAFASASRPAYFPTSHSLTSYLLTSCSCAILPRCVRRTQIGEINKNLDGRVRDELLPVLQEMDALDTEFIIQMVILAGDLSGAYDGFHSQNRNARSGIGNFCSRSFGFVLLVEILDKFRTEGVSGISQRLEKEGLKRGLARLILDCGLLLRDLCTDQCKGAPSDIAAVLDTQPVQKMLKALVPRLRVWVAEQLPCMLQCLQRSLLCASAATQEETDGWPGNCEPPRTATQPAASGPRSNDIQHLHAERGAATAG